MKYSRTLFSSCLGQLYCRYRLHLPSNSIMISKKKKSVPGRYFLLPECHWALPDAPVRSTAFLDAPGRILVGPK